MTPEKTATANLNAVTIADRLDAIIAKMSVAIDDESLRNDRNGIRHFCNASTARNELRALVRELRVS